MVEIAKIITTLNCNDTKPLVKQRRKKLIHLYRDAFLASLFTFGVLFLLKTILINVGYLNPISRALEDFQLTDLYYSNLQIENNEVNKEIVLVNIGYNDRSAIAKQINTLQKYQPKVIGLDAIFYRPKDSLSDQLLAQAIHRANNIVLINKLEYSDASESPILMESDPLFSQNTLQGFSNFLAKENQTIRYFKPSIDLNGEYVESFSSEIVKRYSPEAYKESQKREGRVEVINYGNENFIKLDVDELQSQKLNKILKDKIVLLGFMGRNLGELNLEDLYLTPLNKSFGGHSIPDMYGMEIHANIISMMLSQNYIYEFSKFVNYIITFLVTFLSMVIFIYLSVRYIQWSSNLIKFCQIVLFGLLVFLSLITFHYFNLKVEPFFMLVTVILAAETLVLYSEIVLWMHKRWGFKTYLSQY